MQFTSMILSNVEISPGYWRIRLTAPQEFGAAKPGQFVMVRIGGGIDPLLRRPFAIFDIGTHVPARTERGDQAADIALALITRTRDSRACCGSGSRPASGWCRPVSSPPRRCSRSR